MSPKVYRKLFFWGIALVFLQVWVFSNSYFLGMINPKGYSIFQPMIYPLLIMILPFKMNRAQLLIIAFVVGVLMDIILLTGGMHVLACVVVANFRKNLINALDLSQNLMDSDNMPTFRVLGPSPFFIYSSLFVLMHHLVYFLVQSFSISSFLNNIVVTICSSLFSVFLILIWELMFEPRGQKSRNR